MFRLWNYAAPPVVPAAGNINASNCQACAPIGATPVCLTGLQPAWQRMFYQSIRPEYCETGHVIGTRSYVAGGQDRDDMKIGHLTLRVACCAESPTSVPEAPTLQRPPECWDIACKCSPHISSGILHTARHPCADNLQHAGPDLHSSPRSRDGSPLPSTVPLAALQACEGTCPPRCRRRCPWFPARMQQHALMLLWRDSP